VLYSFDDLADGENPGSALRTDGEGNLFGTTEVGGSHGGGIGGGTVFQLVRPGLGETRWSHRLLHSFGKDHDGTDPLAGLIIDTRGVLYGTTALGGDSGAGTVFRLSPPAAGETRWTETVLYSFKGGNDGSSPRAGLIADANGVLCSTTYWGGTLNGGTVFKLSPPAPGETQWTETVLYSFKGGNDGSGPLGDLIMDHGAHYGMTASGANSNSCDRDCGTVFKLVP